MVELSGRVLEIQNEFNIIKYNLKEEKNNYEALEIKLKNVEAKNKFLEKEISKNIIFLEIRIPFFSFFSCNPNNKRLSF